MIGLTSMLAGLVAAQSGAGWADVPVVTPTPRNVPQAGCSLGIVRIAPGRHLNVRAGPHLRYRRVDRLSAGETVYICNEDSHEQRGDRVFWDGIAYARPGHPCRAARPLGLEARATGDCRSGWARRDWIEILAG